MKTPPYDVCIVGGLGHVGLPLGISLARAGQRVVLYDLNRQVAETVLRGRMPFLEEHATPILRRVLGKQLFVSTDPSSIAASHFVIVVIGTPVDEHLNPDFSVIRRLLDGIEDQLHGRQHLILRSTVYPGTTDKVRDYLASKGKRLRVSFCPERIAQGHAMEELRTLPQIVASEDAKAAKEAARLFSALTRDIVFLNPLEAELGKIFTNTWRYIQFAIANQFYLIASEQGLDFYRIYDAITHKYRRASHFPRAGFAAGPCLFKDTMQLAAHSNNSFFLGHAAMLVNEGLPNHIVATLKRRYGLKDKTVGILGMAFKADSDDKRQSLAYKLRKLLELEAKRVLCSDAYIREEGFIPAAELIRRSDVVVVAAPHKRYRALKIPRTKVLVDVWNFYGKGGRF
jgi:UDP-N-acetyl-D-mannosaminuronic acid dehydrogenase